MTYPVRKWLCKSAISGVALLASAGAADAATKISNASGWWDTSNTWSPSGAPTSTDDVIIAAGHVVEFGNTTVRMTYTIRSLEVRAGGRIQRYNPTNGTFQCGIVCTGIGPTGYSILNRGLIHNQVNSTTFYEANGPVHTDGSSITSRTSQQMGGFSWGWNNIGHSGNAWVHSHSGANGDATSGICLILRGGTLASPYNLTQAASINIDSAPFTASLDALPRTYIWGNYRLASNLEMFSFENRVELNGSLVLNGYRLMSQGPLGVGDPGFNTVTYNQTTFTKGMTALSSGTDLWAYSSSVINYNQSPSQVTIPFTFNFFGTNYTRVWVSINGWMGVLNSYTSSFPWLWMPSTSDPNGVIAGGSYYQNLAATGQRVRYATIGTSPNRHFVVEWNCEDSFSVGYRKIYQVHLVEGSNVIEMHFGSPTSGTTWRTTALSFTTGLEDQAGVNAYIYGTFSPAWATEPTTNLRFTPIIISNPVTRLTVGDGTGTANIGTWPQFRVTAGAVNTWGRSAIVEIPTGSRGSIAIGASVSMIGDARLNIYSEPQVPVALQNGAAPTCWVIGGFAIGGTARVDIQVPATPPNPTNATLQIGQSLDFLDQSFAVPGPSAGLVTQSGNHGATGFPIVLVQSAAGGGNASLPESRWAGTAGGATAGTDTAGWTMTNSTLIHQGGVAAYDSFLFSASGGNPGSAWGLHSAQVGLDQYQWGASTILISNPTNLTVGGLTTSWSLDNVAMSVKGNRAVVNGGGGNLFLSSGVAFTQRKRPTNMPADGSIGVVDVNGNLQVTGGATYDLAINNTAGEESTLRVLGQGTIPPGNITGVPQLQRQAPLGNVSIDDGGSLRSLNERNILVFIGEKWHSSSVTVKIHPSKVTNLLNGTTVAFQATGGITPYTFSILSGSGTMATGVYTAPSTGSGSAVVRVRDSAVPQQFVDAVVSYRGVSFGNLSLSPGYESSLYPGYYYYCRGDLGSTCQLRAYGGSGTYTWTRNGTGTLSGTSGATVTYTANGGTTSSVAVATVTLSDGTGQTRICYLYDYQNTFYGYTYPIPYYAYHYRVNENRTYARPGNSGTWAFSSNPSQCTLNGGSTATGTSVTLMTGTAGGLTPWDFNFYNYGTCTSTTATGYFYFYTTAMPSNLTIGPTQLDGWLPGISYQFAAGGGTTPYTYTLSVNGGGATCSATGLYTAGSASLADDQITLRDSTGVTVVSTVKKGVPTPANGNAYIAVPGAKTIFTNSSVSSVDQIVFADANDDFGNLQVLKTLSTGYKILPSSIEISPILLTMISGTTQTFTAAGGTSPYTYSIVTNNSGATIGASTGVYTAGATINRVDTVQVRDATGKVARATVNVVSSGGSQPLEIRPRYVYYFYPGQAFPFRAIGGVGTVSWMFQTNNSGGSLSGTGLYTAGNIGGGSLVWDTIRVSDTSGNYDIAQMGVYNYTGTILYCFPGYAYFDWNTGAGKSRNGFEPGQTLRVTSVNMPNNGNWTFSINASGGTLSSSGTGSPTAIYTAGNTSNVTDQVQAGQGGTLFTCWYKVQPPAMSISPSQASVFGGTLLRFTAQGGTGTYTYSVLANNSGATISQSGTPAVGLYTAGFSPATDTIRVSDGISFGDIYVSVLATANPTTIFCSHADLWHGELDLNGQTMRVRRQGATPAGQGDLISTNGGIGGATNPTLRMGTGSQLTVDRTFVWNRFSNEFISGGTLTIGGSVKITDDAGGTSPQFDLQAPSGGTSTLVLTAANPDTATANTVDI
ncbi:MAG: hypothetical protein L0216_06365, partial [Planctomycetales bacterium]|nr:hypothetical protein [Planctomycetales bacterium]